MSRLALAASALALWGACAAPIPHPTLLHAQASGVSLTRLEEGRSLFVSHCGNCHFAPAPGTRRAEEWAEVVPQMREDSKLDHQQEGAVLDFLKALAAGAPVSEGATGSAALAR